MEITAAQLATTIGATVEGDPDVVITAPAKIEEAGPGTITFLANPAYEHHLYRTAASAVLVGLDFVPREPVKPTLLRVADVYGTVSQLLEVYQQHAAGTTPRAVSASAAVADTATLGQDVRVGKFTVVEEGAAIGAGTVVMDQVYIGHNVTLGRDCLIHPGARILRDCVVGDRCVIHANVVIGGDGFGFTPDPDTGAYTKVPQVGNVVLEDDVEIGANTTVDRATMGSTILRRGVKLDNLIQIAHNVEVGAHTVIAALTGVAGSAKIGEHCRIGGQVGIAGHTEMRARTQVQAQTGVIASIRQKDAKLGGSPHMHYPDYLRSYAVFKNLPAEMARLRQQIAALREEVQGHAEPGE